MNENQSGRRAPSLIGRPVLVAVATAITLAGLIGGLVGCIAGIGCGLLTYRSLCRRPSPVRVADERRVDAELPFTADLLAAAMRAGASQESAAGCVAEAVGGPTGERLARVDRALRLGAPADEAWSYLGTTDAARRIGDAAIRSQHSGVAMAGSLQRIADDLRADGLIAADARARRAGTLIVLPLGLCFLPAFVLTGLVPVIVAVLGGVLSP